MSAAILNGMSTEIPPNLLSEFTTWEAGFDARTRFEKTGIMEFNPYRLKQGALWQSGYNASRYVSEIGLFDK